MPPLTARTRSQPKAKPGNSVLGWTPVTPPSSAQLDAKSALDSVQGSPFPNSSTWSSRKLLSRSRMQILQKGLRKMQTAFKTRGKDKL